MYKAISTLFVCLLLIFTHQTSQSVAESIQQTPEPGTIVIDRYGFEMVYVPSGSFEMGITSQDFYDFIVAGALGDIPEEQVDLVRNMAAEQGVFDTYTTTVPGFWIDRYEVTIDQYRSRTGLCIETGQCSKIDMSSTPELASDSRQPQVAVTWFDAMRFCIGREARLPTEEEWEYAASGPDNRLFPWGDKLILDYMATDTTYPVGTIAGNVSWIGVYDLAGNAGEWVEDRLMPYSNTSQNQASIPAIQSDTRWVIRGGSYRTPVNFLTTFARRSERPDAVSEIGVGFRCARTAVHAR